MAVAVTDVAMSAGVASVTGSRRPGLWCGLFPAAIALALLGVLAASRADVVAADWVRFALVTAWAAAGLACLRRASLFRFGRLLLLGAALGATAFAAARYGATGTGAGADLATTAAPFACLLLVALSAHVVLALPHGELGSRGRRIGAGLGYVAALLGGLALRAGGDQVTAGVGIVAWAVAVVTTMPAAHRRYLTSTGLVRQQLQWLGCGVTLAGEVAVATGALHLFIGWPAHAGAIAALGTSLIAAAVAASSSPRLAGRVDRALVHTVSALGLTVVVIAVYVVIVLGLGRSPRDSERQLLGLSMIAAGVVAVAYVPARRWLTDLGNRLVYGEQNAPDDALRTFGMRLTRATPMDELLLQLAESLHKTMALGAAEVWTASGDVLERVSSVPDRGHAVLGIGQRELPIVTRAGVSGTAWIAIWLPALLDGRSDASLRVAPITHSGKLLGVIVVERPAHADLFDEEDDRVLTELARQLGLALHNVQLDSALQASLDEVRRQADELRASRARVVASADAERRKIERNLHDGAQQHLVALAVNLRLARDIVTDDPAGAVEMLDAMAGDVKETVQELRDLAHGIYPPLLRDSGVVDALRAAVRRSPLEVELTAEGATRYPAEIEAAVYFCCLEALQNAAKHAPDARVEVRLWEEMGALLFSVTDDGPGFDAAMAGRGHGFTNMSDRLGAIGGTVRWDSAPGAGTTVRGTIPATS